MEASEADIEEIFQRKTTIFPVHRGGSGEDGKKTTSDKRQVMMMREKRRLMTGGFEFVVYIIR